jgi:hypothetical protein
MADTLSRALDAALDRFRQEGMMWDGCLGYGDDISPGFYQHLQRAIDMRFVAALPGVDIGRRVDAVDRRLQRAFRPFNSSVELQDITQILNSAVGGILQEVQAATRDSQRDQNLRFKAPQPGEPG